MQYAATANSLLEKARLLAQQKFAEDTSGRNQDKVCVVAISIADSDNAYALFSGAPGYSELTDLVRSGGDRKAAQQRITSTLTEFLQTEDGGSFSHTQITHTAYDLHGRGAMNCAEPKMYYLLKHHHQLSLRNWVLMPFNMSGMSLVYNAPCKNCRRWVYRHFHPLSGLIAQSQKGPAAFEE